MESTDKDRRPGRSDGTPPAAVRTPTVAAVQLDKRTLEAIIAGVTAKLQDGTSRLARPSQGDSSSEPQLGGETPVGRAGETGDGPSGSASEEVNDGGRRVGRGVDGHGRDSDRRQGMTRAC